MTCPLHRAAHAVFSLPISSCNKGAGKTSLLIGTGVLWA